MSTKERLATVLAEHGAPDWMIKNARNGQYDDFESSSATPIAQLVSDCRQVGLSELANRAINGDFDATAEESEAWFEREGKDIFK